MIKCPNCGKEMPDGFAFCDACGAKLTVRLSCPRCGEPADGNQAFCAKCGAPLKPPAPNPAPAGNAPTQPVKPAPTAAPAHPTNPAPARATAAPVQPTGPAPVQQVRPAPTQPVKPAPVQPTAAPAHPTNPAPAQPTPTAVPVQPMDPAPAPAPIGNAPTQPVGPAPTAVPTQPTNHTPVQPVRPTPTAVPVKPANPVPVQPAPTAAPTHPTNPAPAPAPVGNAPTQPVQTTPTQTAKPAPVQQVRPAPMQPVPPTGPAPVPPTNYAPTPPVSPVPVQPGYAPVPEETAAQPKKSGKGKIFLFGGIGLAVVAAAIVAVVLIFFRGGRGTTDRLFYVKDDELWFAEPSGKNNGAVTQNLFSGGDPFGRSTASGIGSALSRYITYSADGKRIFYPDFSDMDGVGVTLYCRDAAMKTEPLRIDTGITSYAVNNTGTQVVYLKDSKLYLHNLQDKERIASDVWSFYVTEDLAKVGYYTDDGGYYIWTAKDGEVKVAGDMDYICRVSEDLNTVWYVRDNSLYRRTVGEDRIKIDSDVSYVLNVYDTGEIYYTKSESTDRALYDFVEDDMADADAMIYEPDYPIYPDEPDYPYLWDFDSYEEYDQAVQQYEAAYNEYVAECDRLYDEYLDAYDVYNDKLTRDYLRSDLESASVNVTEISLYYFDGSTTSEIATGLANEWNVAYAGSSPLVAFCLCEREDPHFIFSEIESASDVYDEVYDAMNPAAVLAVASGAGVTELGADDTYDIMINDAGRLFYTVRTSDSDDAYGYATGDLYEVPMTGGTPSAATLVDTDIYINYVNFTEDGRPVYFKEVADNVGDMYIDKQAVGYDVYMYAARAYGNDVLFYSDWSMDRSSGTLYLYANGTSTKVSDDAGDAFMTSSGAVLYLYDYSLRYNSGTLCLYSNGNTVKLDEDVAAIVPFSGNGAR